MHARLLAMALCLPAAPLAAQERWEIPGEAQAAILAGDHRRALQLIETSLATCRRATSDERACALLWLSLSNTAASAGDRATYEHAKRFYDSLGLPPHKESYRLRAQDRRRPFGERGIYFSLADERGDAKAMYQLDVVQAVSQFGPESARAGLAYGRLGRQRTSTGSPELSRGLGDLRRAIRILERWPQLDRDGELRMNIESLAFGLEKMRLFDLAEPHWRRGVVIADRDVAKSGYAPVSTRENLARNLATQRKYAELEKVQRELLALRRHIFVPDAILWTYAHVDLADALAGQGKWAEARTYYRIGSASALRKVESYRTFEADAANELAGRRPIFRAIVRTNWKLADAAAGLPAIKRRS